METISISIKKKTFNKAIVILLAFLLVSVANNQFKLNEISSLSPGGLVIATGLETAEASVIPTGVPKTYGGELEISYDDVNAYDPQLADFTIQKMANIDRTLELNPGELQRYIKIVSEISCEYCCGARSIINPDGGPACGCAHSYAMRGLAKYLIRNHASEYSDDEILEELGKWKALFFPGQMEAKAKILSEQGIELNYLNLASNKYRGIEQGAAGSGMVGGC